jgi:hypothetical protein
MLAPGDQLPFRIAFMGANGAFVTGVVREGGSALKAELNTVCGEALALPIDMMIADATCEATLLRYRKTVPTPGEMIENFVAHGDRGTVVRGSTQAC